MTTISPLEFNYKSRTYHALVRKRFKAKESQYQVTVLNSGLEKLLYGHDIFVLDKEGKLHVASVAKDSSVKELLDSITSAFQGKLQEMKSVMDLAAD